MSTLENIEQLIDRYYAMPNKLAGIETVLILQALNVLAVELSRIAEALERVKTED